MQEKKVDAEGERWDEGRGGGEHEEGGEGSLPSSNHTHLFLPPSTRVYLYLAVSTFFFRRILSYTIPGHSSHLIQFCLSLTCLKLLPACL